MNDRRIAAFDGTTSPITETVANVIVLTQAELDNLDKPAADCSAMMPYWDQTDTIVMGTDAVRLAGKKYLPKLPNETVKDYNFRLSVSKFTNIYRDVVENLASKPFENEVTFADEKAVPPDMGNFVKDVDGAGSDISGFSVDTFFNGINSGIDWIFVDYTSIEGEDDSGIILSKAQEEAAGLRPFWTHVRGRNMLEIKTEILSGTEELMFVRILEPTDTTCFVRIIQRTGDNVVWTLYQKVTDPTANKWTFKPIESGTITIGVIPLVPFLTGRRNGRTWRFYPPMRDAADLQIELYQQESGLKHVRTMSAFPMIAANGVQPAKGPDNKPLPMPVGPLAILYAPPYGDGKAGSYEMLEPASTTMTFLAADVKDTINQLRELGRNPLTAQSGNLTVITTAVAAKKGNSAVQLWALGLKGALTNALKITMLWYGLDPKKSKWQPDVSIYTDFDIDGPLKETIESLTAMRDNGDLSQTTYWAEMKRRGVLSAEFDAEDETDKLKAEALLKVPGEEAPNPGLGDPNIDPNNPGAPPKPGAIILPPSPLKTAPAAPKPAA